MNTNLIAAAVVALTACLAVGETYYVHPASPHANDKNPGTLQRPFKTLQAATQAASQPGDTIHILPQREPATFFVDQNNPRASDENPGTAEAPFKTIQRAAEAVLPGDTVKIRPGRYRETIVLHNPGQNLNVNDGMWETRRFTF